jgi:trimeric autotransporter adhesin
MRFTRALAFVTTCLAAVALGGCGLNPSGTGTGTTMRVVNLMPGTTPVTVTANGTAYMTAAPFETFTGYQNISAGTYTFNVNLGTSSTPSFTAPETLGNVSAYTFIAYGPTTLPGAVLLTDTLLTNIPTGEFGFRLSNLSPSAGLIDAYVTAPGADLAAASPVVSSMAYNLFSNFVNVPVGNYELRLTRSGTKQVIFDAPLPAALSGGGQTVVAYTRGSGRLVNVALFTDGVAATTLPNALAQIKAVNASSVGSPLNLLVDGNITLANVPYASASNYQNVATGQRTITVEASATPGATLLTTSPTLGAATDTSIALYGSAGALQSLILTDFNVPTLIAQARVRFVNVSSAVAAVDVYANGTLAASAVGPNAASDYMLLSASIDGSTYQFDFDPAGTTTPVLTLPGVTLVGGSVYTIYLIGPPGAVQAIVSQDL